MNQLDTTPVWRPALPAILAGVVMFMIVVAIAATVAAVHV